MVIRTTHIAQGRRKSKNLKLSFNIKIANMAGLKGGVGGLLRKSSKHNMKGGAKRIVQPGQMGSLPANAAQVAEGWHAGGQWYPRDPRVKSGGVVILKGHKNQKKIGKKKKKY